MPVQNHLSVPEFRDWSIAAVRLLQGVIYADDVRVWDILLRSRSTLETHFARFGLLLVVDEPEGYAFVRQWSDDECPEGYEQLPKLIRRVQLGYSPTLLAVLLRDELRRYEEEEVHNERCVVEADVLFEQWRSFFPAQVDEVRQRKEFASSLNKLEDLGFVRKFGDNPESWEVRRILKARLPAAELEALKDQLRTAHAGTHADPCLNGGTGDA
jgi:hypothetical protein